MEVVHNMLTLFKYIILYTYIIIIRRGVTYSFFFFLFPECDYPLIIRLKNVTIIETENI